MKVGACFEGLERDATYTVVALESPLFDPQTTYLRNSGGKHRSTEIVAIESRELREDGWWYEFTCGPHDTPYTLSEENVLRLLTEKVEPEALGN